MRIYLDMQLGRRALSGDCLRCKIDRRTAALVCCTSATDDGSPRRKSSDTPTNSSTRTSRRRPESLNQSIIDYLLGRAICGRNVNGAYNGVYC